MKNTKNKIKRKEEKSRINLSNEDQEHLGEHHQEG